MAAVCVCVCVCISRGGMGHQQLRGGLGQRDDSEDAAYWDSMANVIPENNLRIWAELDRKSTRLNYSHWNKFRMPSFA